MASAWDEGCSSNGTVLSVVDFWTENEIFLSLESIAIPSESVSFLLPVFAFPLVWNQSLLYSDDIWEKCR